MRLPLLCYLEMLFLCKTFEYLRLPGFALKVLAEFGDQLGICEVRKAAEFS